MKTYAIIQKTIQHGKVVTKFKGEVQAASKEKAIASIGAEQPKLVAHVCGITFYRDLAGWLFMVTWKGAR